MTASMTASRIRQARIVAAILPLVAVTIRPPGAWAHDTWVEASQRLGRVGDVLHIDLFLGNHGNEHRDFKIAGKLASLDGATLEVIAPDGRRTDLLPAAVDLGFAPKEGFWSARFVPAGPGLHGVAHTRSGIHNRKRGIKSGKAYFLAADQLDAPPPGGLKHAEPLGHPLELVPETHPALGTGPGRAITVRLMFRGMPLADHRVSFVPRGATLAAGFDPRFERRTDAAGRCSFEPREGNLLLVVAHLEAPDETGPDFDRTVYAATLVLDVPQTCPCCEE
jgi:uncharacterized GH25 family protein